ncbi:vWA domain-containing protein [Haladaptatus sp. NG-WS-4]
MSDKKFEFSRRKALLGLSTIGAGAAFGGAGTMAFLNDPEMIENNVVTAGNLDLKIDWEEHYNGEIIETQPPADNPGPIFELDDVKPGDYGEATISLHVYDNPAYIWLAGELTASEENGQREPELETEGEDGDGIGELADAIYARLWYDDDCDNKFDRVAGGQELEVALVSDDSGSMRGSNLTALKTAATGFVDNFSSPDEGAAISFSYGATVDQELTTNYEAIKSAIGGYTAGGGTDIAAGIEAARDELLNGTNATASATKVMVLLSDGRSDEAAAKDKATIAKGDGIRIITVALGSGADTTLMEEIASSPDDAYVGGIDDLGTIYSSIATSIFSGEQVITEGTLTEVLAYLNGDIALDGDRSTEEVDCYTANTKHCLGFEWWLPKEAATKFSPTARRSTSTSTPNSAGTTRPPRIPGLPTAEHAERTVEHKETTRSAATPLFVSDERFRTR